VKQALLTLSLNVKKPRKAQLLEQMDRVVPWAEFVALIAPFELAVKNDHPPFTFATMLHGQEAMAFGDAGCWGLDKGRDDKSDALIDEAEKLKTAIRVKLEHPFRVIKRQFGFVKVRYWGLAKTTTQLKTLFALSNRLRMFRCKLMGAGV
jgi:hypothetical protein